MSPFHFFQKCFLLFLIASTALGVVIARLEERALVKPLQLVDQPQVFAAPGAVTPIQPSQAWTRKPTTPTSSAPQATQPAAGSSADKTAALNIHNTGIIMRSHFFRSLSVSLLST